MDLNPFLKTLLTAQFNLHLCERAWPEGSCLLVETCSLPRINMLLSKVNKKLWGQIIFNFYLKIGLKVSASCSGHFSPEVFCLDSKNNLDTLEKRTSSYFCLEQKLLQEIL